MSPRRAAPAIAASSVILVAATAVVVLAATPTNRRLQPASRSTAATVTPPARAPWGVPDAASIALIRHAVVLEASLALPSLAHCDERVRTVAAARRGSAYARCALTSLARLGASGSTNAAMLLRIRGDAGPRKSCSALIGSLAGNVAVLGLVARAALRTELAGQTPSRDVDRASREIRALARGARRLAVAPGWRHACQPNTKRVAAQAPPVA